MALFQLHRGCQSLRRQRSRFRAANNLAVQTVLRKVWQGLRSHRSTSRSLAALHCKVFAPVVSRLLTAWKEWLAKLDASRNSILATAQSGRLATLIHAWYNAIQKVKKISRISSHCQLEIILRKAFLKLLHGCKTIAAQKRVVSTQEHLASLVRRRVAAHALAILKLAALSGHSLKERLGQAKEKTKLRWMRRGFHRLQARVATMRSCLRELEAMTAHRKRLLCHQGFKAWCHGCIRGATSLLAVAWRRWQLGANQALAERRACEAHALARWQHKPGYIRHSLCAWKCFTKRWTLLHPRIAGFVQQRMFSCLRTMMSLLREHIAVAQRLRTLSQK